MNNNKKGDELEEDFDDSDNEYNVPMEDEEMEEDEVAGEISRKGSKVKVPFIQESQHH